MNCIAEQLVPIYMTAHHNMKQQRASLTIVNQSEISEADNYMIKEADPEAS